jgi:hypothetical protein
MQARVRGHTSLVYSNQSSTTFANHAAKDLFLVRE